MCICSCRMSAWIWLLLLSHSDVSQTDAPLTETSCFSARKKKTVVRNSKLQERIRGVVGRWMEVIASSVEVSESPRRDRERGGESEDGQPPSKMASPEENEWKILKRGLLSWHFLLNLRSFSHFGRPCVADQTRRRFFWAPEEGRTVGSRHFVQ